ncbi:MAG: PIN domain-containing protein [Bacteroidetes bacterium]|nr:PIN domain-containing protein [Bacteroidota bacterium]
MKQRLYIDTSVFGGFYDEEFAEFTKPLFERLQKGEFTLLFSKVTQEELALAPDNVKQLVENIKIENTEFIEANEETVELATQYILEKVVGQTSLPDCLHIALATINRADFLISWNFKHIVNVQRIRGYNAINIKNGYKQIEIRSPRDFMTYGDND